MRSEVEVWYSEPMTENTEFKCRNDNNAAVKLDETLSRDAMDAELRASIQSWLDKGVPEDRISEVAFGLVKDLAYHSLKHRQDDPDGAFERYQQISDQSGALHLLQWLSRKRYIKSLSQLD